MEELEGRMHGKIGTENTKNTLRMGIIHFRKQKGMGLLEK